MGIRIVGSGSYIPGITVTNEAFRKHVFLDENGKQLGSSTESIIEKFLSITGIEERRYAEPHLLTSDMAFIASERAIEDAGIDRESLDYIILAHNFGDIEYGQRQSSMVPSLASRVKHKLGIKNPRCVAYDVIFGCPGWLESVIQASAFTKAGIAKRCLVIGADCLSRMTDDFDRDSMIYADGAGATVMEVAPEGEGLLSHESATFASDEGNYLFLGKSYNADEDQNIRHIKMYGRKIYEFALKNVPLAMKSCLEKSGYGIDQVKKIMIHQANAKMDEAILLRFYKLFHKAPPENVMPMCIHKLGNSSVASIPTLYDLLVKGNLEDHKVQTGDIVIFASVGAGMSINAFIYKV